MQKLFIDWICPTPTPYNNFLFNYLSATPEFDLEVHFIRPANPDHPWNRQTAMQFRRRDCRMRFGIDWPLLRRACACNRVFVVSGWDRTALRALILCLGAMRRDYVFWSDTLKNDRARNPVTGALRRGMARFVFATAKGVMGTGRPGCAAFRQLGCPPEKLIIFPFFVDLGQWDAARRTWAPDGVVRIITVGRLRNELKGMDIGLAALAAVKQDGASNFEYSIVGTGPDENRLREQVAGLGLHDHVRFTGWLEAEQTEALMRESDVLLHPARIDPFPVVVLEAMARGVVVLGSDACGSVLDRIQHGQNGCIHRVGNVAELGRQIRVLLKSPLGLAPLGHAARVTAEAWPVSRALDILKHTLGSDGIAG